MAINRFAPVRTESGFKRALIALMLLGFLALIAAAAFAGRSAVSARTLDEWTDHTRRVEIALAGLAAATERGETARRGYLIRRDARFLSTWSDAKDQVRTRTAEARTLVRDNPGQLARLSAFATAQARLAALDTRTMTLAEGGDLAAARALFAVDGSAELLRAMRRQIDTLAVTESALLDQRSAERDLAQRRLYQVLALAGGLIVVVALLSLLLVRRFTVDLAGSRQELRVLNAGLEEMVGERTHDLQRANDEIQRFAYIVSHDLRSPLVNVMGFTAELDAARQPIVAMIDQVSAEAPHLVSADARLAATEDLPEAIGFIRTSTAKMDRLINAILKLSREGRRVIMPEQVAMEPLVTQIADSLRHRADEVDATIIVEPDLPDFETDRLAIEQILSNLVENAVKYTKPGRPARIVISGESTRDRVTYAVSDDGRGIDPRDHQRIFDLFRRSGMQDQTGEGIGLAHVRATVHRLGGLIDCDSRLDEGATFRLSFPLRYQGERGAQA